MIKTVLGDIPENSLGITLSHEHICNYCEYLRMMAGEKYLDTKLLIDTAVEYLKFLKNEYGLASIIDCSTVNIGRDIDILKEVSERAEINIVCSTGFYYTNEPVMAAMSAESIGEIISVDAAIINAGVIKCAVEDSEINGFTEKLLIASAISQKATGLPIIMHTNANNQNGIKALKILIEAGANPKSVTVGHLSDTEDLEYIEKIASFGCYIGYDRLYDNHSDEYINKTVNAIKQLCAGGFENQLLLSHDATFFSGFDAVPKIIEKPRFDYCFEHILPKLPKEFTDIIMIENPAQMLSNREE